MDTRTVRARQTSLPCRIFRGVFAVDLLPGALPWPVEVLGGQSGHSNLVLGPANPIVAGGESFRATEMMGRQAPANLGTCATVDPIARSLEDPLPNQPQQPTRRRRRG
jgi:hypothetical protein